MNLSRKFALYAIPPVILSAGGLLIVPFQLSTEVIFVAIGFNISLSLDLVNEQILKRRSEIQFIDNERELVKRYEEFKEDSVNECMLTWTTKYKITDIDDYFRKERESLSKKDHYRLLRMVETSQSNWNRADLMKHLEQTTDLRNSGKYDCRETTMQGLEIAYSDYKSGGDIYHRALLVMNSRERKIGLLFDERLNTEDALMVFALKSLFESEWRVAKTAPPHE
ncbi:MAG: hypothetical protein JRM73_03090 [Nitrososphaerota archaeon]|nr:hypothetical protein [Nitrososphaerota archaeon]